jgi:hypothetical protein
MIGFLNFPRKYVTSVAPPPAKTLRPENEPQIGGGIGGQPRLALEVTSPA